MAGDFRGDLADDLAGVVLRDLEGERWRLRGDSDWRNGVLSRAEPGVVCGCGEPGDGGGSDGACEVVVMVGYESRAL